MTDEKPKQVWTRCPACRTRIFNSKADIDGHKLNCPYDIKLELQKALDRIQALEEQVEGLDEQVAETPAIDLDGVAPWDPDTAPDPDEDQPASTYIADDVNATITLNPEDINKTDGITGIYMGNRNLI